MRRFLAILISIITTFAIIETFYIFSATDKDIVSKKAQLSIAAITITLPLVLLSIWLWKNKRTNNG
jgi:uncharacterized membrane protein (GlpM family)